jgi:predicted cupin superfamily sugar epimerase
MVTAEKLIETLKLTRHPEGGYFRETYRSHLMIGAASLAIGFEGERSVCTSIYFLLPYGDCSTLHRIKSDEIWHYHMGAALSIYVFDKGRLNIYKLGPNLEAGENLQIVVPANAWFGAICPMENSFTLCSCIVSPGFDFNDFELAQRKHILLDLPAYEKEIVMLTRPD